MPQLVAFIQTVWDFLNPPLIANTIYATILVSGISYAVGNTLLDNLPPLCNYKSYCHKKDLENLLNIVSLAAKRTLLEHIFRTG
jgi:hypothetical protein